jgi:hypothetical protein
VEASNLFAGLRRYAMGARPSSDAISSPFAMQVGR